MIGAALTRLLARARLVPSWAWLVAGIALVACLGAIWLHFHDKGVVADHEARLEARAAPAREHAADRRAADAIANTEQKEAYHEAIATAVAREGDRAPGPAAVALNCERLRRAGVALPAACRPGGGD